MVFLISVLERVKTFLKLREQYSKIPISGLRIIYVRYLGASLLGVRHVDSDHRFEKPLTDPWSSPLRSCNSPA